MATAAEVAAWMVAELERSGTLALVDAVREIHARFGPQFAPDGIIRSDVLAAFRRRGPRRDWVGSAREWRLHPPHDPPRDSRRRGLRPDA